MSGSCHIQSVEMFVKYLFSFNFQLKNAATEFCFLGHLHAIKVPQLKRDKASKLNKSDLYSLRSDFCSAENLRENKDSKFNDNFNALNMT